MYEVFSKWYDQLNEQEFYEMWYHEMRTSCDIHSAKDVLDLGCGSGRLLELLAPDVQSLTGVDLSEQMLTLARERLKHYTSKVKLFSDDIGELILPREQYDIIVSTCDTLNYLESEEKLGYLFGQVYQALKQEGCFLFDMHSDYTFTQIFPTWSYADQHEALSVLWNTYTEDNFLFEHFLTFFYRDGQGTYHRYDEVHQQYFYPSESVLQRAKAAGFTHIQMETDFSGKFSEEGRRIIYKMKKE